MRAYSVFSLQLNLRRRIRVCHRFEVFGFLYASQTIENWGRRSHIRTSFKVKTLPDNEN